MNVVSFDPGIDATGWACLKVGRGSHANINAAVRGLIAYGEIETDPGETMPERLAGVAKEVSLLIREKRPTYVILETPSYAGAYTGGKERFRSVAKLYQAIGAIQAAAALELWSSGQVVRVPAIRQPKEVRHGLLQDAFRKVGLDWPEGPRGGQREDAVDAIWVGVQWILENGRKVVRSA